jgi:chemotaxis protein MotB
MAAGGGGGGGAWKVAYADFVTAMMALFMVLWISAQDKKILIATSRYFQNPFKSPMEERSGIMPFNQDASRSSSRSGADETAGQEQEADKDKRIQLHFLNSVAADFTRLLHLDQNWEDKPIDIQVTSDGLRLTVFDRASRPVFAGRTTEFTEWGTFLLQNLAWIIDRHKFLVTIDGHTRAGLELGGDYTTWELSSDRANAARRALVRYAVDAARIERVSGYADTVPLEGVAPAAEENQRMTISLRVSAPRPRAREVSTAPAPGGAAPASLPDLTRPTPSAPFRP